MRYQVWEKPKDKWVLYDTQTEKILVISKDRRIVLRTYLYLSKGNEWDVLFDKSK